MAPNNALAPSPATSIEALAFPDDMIEAPPSTKRFAAAELANQLAAMMVEGEPSLDVENAVLDETLTLTDLGIDHDDDFPVLTASGSHAVHRVDVEDRDVRRLVVAIWTIAIAIAAVFTYVVLQEESARAQKVPSPVIEMTSTPSSP